MSAYQKWIESNYPTRHSAYGQCAEATSRMIAAFPELRRVRGHYLCLVWGQREHWWCVAPDGKIVDPTRHQFPTVSSTAYTEWDETKPEPTGMCPNCGGYCFDGNYCCSTNCERAYVAYCSNPHT